MRILLHRSRFQQPPTLGCHLIYKLSIRSVKTLWFSQNNAFVLYSYEKFLNNYLRGFDGECFPFIRLMITPFYLLRLRECCQVNQDDLTPGNIAPVVIKFPALIRFFIFSLCNLSRKYL